MSSRMSGKVYRYALFYFPQTNEVGTARTTAISEGYRCQVSVGSVVKVRWENETQEVPAKILQMDDEVNVLWAAERTVNLESLAAEASDIIKKLQPRGKKRTHSAEQPSSLDPDFSTTHPMPSPSLGFPTNSSLSQVLPPVTTSTLLPASVCSEGSEVLPSVTVSMDVLATPPLCSTPPYVNSPISPPPPPAPSFSSSSTSNLSSPLPQSLPPVSAAAPTPIPLCSSFPNLLPPISIGQSSAAPVCTGNPPNVSLPALVFPSPHQVLPPIPACLLPPTSVENVLGVVPPVSTKASFASHFMSNSTILPPIPTGRITTPLSTPFGLPPLLTTCNTRTSQGLGPTISQVLKPNAPNVPLPSSSQNANVLSVSTPIPGIQGLFPSCSTPLPSITPFSSTLNIEPQLSNLPPLQFSPEPSPTSTPDAAAFFPSKTPPSLSLDPSTQERINQIYQHSILHTQLLHQIINTISGPQLALTPSSCQPQNQECNNQLGQEVAITEMDITELKNASSSSVNFSVKLLNKLFSEEELCHRNVHGGHGRQALDPEKLSVVKRLYFKVFPCEHEGTEWQKCVNAINAHLRKYHKKKQ